MQNMPEREKDSPPGGKEMMRELLKRIQAVSQLPRDEIEKTLLGIGDRAESELQNIASLAWQRGWISLSECWDVFGESEKALSDLSKQENEIRVQAAREYLRACIQLYRSGLVSSPRELKIFAVRTIDKYFGHLDEDTDIDKYMRKAPFPEADVLRNALK